MDAKNLEKKKLRMLFIQWVIDNSVMVLFIIICAIGICLAKQPASYLVGEIVSRLFRNLVLILSLIVPVWAGMGLNFSIVLGAMAAQAGLIFIMNYNILGLWGLALSLILSVPLAVVLGFFTGKLFNRTKGQEMITGMIMGYFANGVYQLFFMYICGTLIPMANKSILLPTGIGVNGIINMDESLSGAIDKVWKLSLDKVIIIFLLGSLLYTIAYMIRNHKKKLGKKCYWILAAELIVLAVFMGLVKLWPEFNMVMKFTRVPMVTFFFVICVCVFLQFLSATKLGADIKAVGQSIPIARVSGINVEKVRIIAVIISTVIAALGQMIYLQNLGTFTTYSAHEQIGTFSIAALLIGGASTKKAGIMHAILGGILFHIMFIVAPLAGKNVFNDAQIGEYFRVFASYIVIALALALHAWKAVISVRKKK